MKTLSPLFLLSVALLSAQATIIDDFTDGNLDDFSQTVILDNGGGSHNGSVWQIIDGRLQISTEAYSDIEQSAFIKTNFTLNVGEELRTDYVSNGGNRAMGLYVGVVPADGIRRNFVTVYSESSTSVLSRGFNGTAEMNLKSAAGNYTKLFIARDGANDYEAGFYNGNTRVVVADRNGLLFGDGDTLAIGFYADVRSAGVIGLADNMEIASTSAPPVIVTAPTDVTIKPLQSAVFETAFTSVTAPAVEWYKITPDGDIAVELSESIRVAIAGDAQNGSYTSTLSMASPAISDSGQYYCTVTNDSEITAVSAAANLTVCGLVAHWTLDGTDFTGSHYTDLTGGLDAQVEAIPVFTAGANEAENGAVQIRPEGGWASAGSGGGLALSGSFTISCWFEWQGNGAGSSDLLVDSGDDTVVAIQNGLCADTMWHHICAVLDGTFCKLYLDGIPAGESECVISRGMTTELNIGSAAAGSESFIGCLDDIRIYNYPLNGTEVAQLRFDFTGQMSCILSYAGFVDWNGPDGEPDCRIDTYDLAAFAASYLSVDGKCDLTGPANVPDGQVNLLDFAELCFVWMDSGLYPETD